MKDKRIGWAFIVLGIALLVPGLPFPDISMSVVQYTPPSSITLTIMLVLPLLYILFGIVTLFTKKIGKVALLLVSILFALATVWAIPYLGVIQYYEPGMSLNLGTIEFKVVGSALVFVALTAALAYESMRPNKQIN